MVLKASVLICEVNGLANSETTTDVFYYKTRVFFRFEGFTQKKLEDRNKKLKENSWKCLFVYLTIFYLYVSCTYKNF